MKKILIATLLSFGLITSAGAIGANIGVSLSVGNLEADNASENFTGAHSSSASPGDVKKQASAEGDAVEGQFAQGSIFVEATLGDRFSIGLDYVPQDIESETTENITNIANGKEVAAQATNTVQVDFTDLYTVYAKINFNENVYFKLGHVQVDVITNEALATGGGYGNGDLSGTTVALGYQHNFNSNMFARVEGFQTEMDGITLTNTTDSTKSVSADGVDLMGMTLSLGIGF